MDLKVLDEDSTSGIEVISQKEHNGSQDLSVTSSKNAITNGKEGVSNGVAEKTPMRLTGTSTKRSQKFDDEDEPFLMTIVKRDALRALSYDTPKTKTIICRDWLAEFRLISPTEGIRCYRPRPPTNRTTQYVQNLPRAPPQHVNITHYVQTVPIARKDEEVPKQTKITKVEATKWTAKKSSEPNGTPVRVNQDREVTASKTRVEEQTQNGSSDSWDAKSHSAFKSTSSRYNYELAAIESFVLDSPHTMDVFKEGGVISASDPNYKLHLGHQLNPALSFTCKNCPEMQPFPKMNLLAKHIETNHCPTMLICLLCPTDEKGCAPTFESANGAFEHAMHYHHGVSRYYFCDFCELLLNDHEAIEAHMVEYHPEQGLPETPAALRRYPCLLCLWPFRQSGHRKDHFRSNHDMNVELKFPKRPKGSYASWGLASPISQKRKYNKVTKEPADEKNPDKVENKSPKKSKIKVEPQMSEDTPTVKTKTKSATKTTSEPKSKSTNAKQMPVADPMKLADAMSQVPVAEVEIIAEVTTPSSTICTIVELSPSKRNILKPELKDKYAEILQKQPKVYLNDIFEDPNIKPLLGDASKRDPTQLPTINLKKVHLR